MTLTAADRDAIRQRCERPSDRLVTQLRTLAKAFKSAREGLSKSHPTECWVLTMGDVLEEAATRIQGSVMRADRVYSPEHTDKAFARVAWPESEAMVIAEQQREQLSAFLDSRAFYDVMQNYRHESATSPGEVVEAFEAVKAAIRATGATPEDPR